MLQIAQAQSALRWDSKTLELRPSQAEKTVRAEFGFINTSAQSVTIRSVKSSCGCTTAALEKMTYQPGEKGHVTAIFTIGGRKGTQVKGISVAVEGESEPATLTMVTLIPEVIKIEPQFVFWRTGEAPSPKTIKLKLPASMGLRLARVSSSDPKMSTVLETVREGAEYRITVTPTGTERQTMATLNIQAVSGANEPKVFQAYAQVKGAGGSDR